jgi:His/Glu/Gln/Arg/opine family amino acid ABC transporter permease subunit
LEQCETEGAVLPFLLRTHHGLRHWGVFLEQAAANETYLDWMISGLKVTIALGLSSWIIALAIGSVLGVLRTVPNKWLSGIAATYVEIFRNIPLLVQLFIWYFVGPELLPGGETIKQMNPFTQQFLAAMLCLGSSPPPGSASRCARASTRCRAARRTPAWRWVSRCRRPTATCCCRWHSASSCRR